MARARRHKILVWIFCTFAVVVAYSFVTTASAGSEAACNHGTGHIAWVWQPIPRFACVVTPQF